MPLAYSRGMRYVILGESGSYSDYRAWPLASADNKENAEKVLAFIQQQLKDFSADMAPIVAEEKANSGSRPVFHNPCEYPSSYDENGKYIIDAYKDPVYKDKYNAWKEQNDIFRKTPEWLAWAAQCDATRAKRKTVEQRYQRMLFNNTVDILYLYEVEFRIVEVPDSTEYMNVR